jgi:hypothetical protein
MKILSFVVRPVPVVVLAAAFLAGTTPAFAASWKIVSSPNSGLSSFLYGVAAASSADVWAVGDTINSVGTYQALTEHWNGSSWSIVACPSVPGRHNYLGDAVALSSSDVWATGYTNDGLSEQTLVEHWNGTSWSIVPSPNPGGTGIGQNNFLGNIAAVSPTDIWAVGFYTAGGTHQTLTVHWDGSSWSQVSSPNVNGDSFLNGVTAVAGDDVWASGAYIDASGAQRTLVEHWNGTSWSVVPSQSLNVNELLVQMSNAGGNVWAVGYSGTSTTSRHTLVEEWNGAGFSVVASPAPGTAYDGLNGVVATSATDAWATGYQAPTGGARRTLTEHWNGVAWSAVTSPNSGSGDNTLEGVGSAGGTTLWAAGFYYTKSQFAVSKTLLERYS